MIINKLKIINFKNHENSNYEFSPKINCFVGNNGVGKTNILDALHYTSVGKSFLGNSDNQNIKQGEFFFTIETLVADVERESVLKIQFQKEQKKIIKKNDKSYDKLSDHIGFIPHVMISPYDSNLISDSGESRRKFLDAMISQTNPEYLHYLVQYHKILKQRNALLKYFQKNRNFDVESLEIYNLPLIKSGTILHEKRKKFILELNPTVQEFYRILSNNKEQISLEYISDIHTSSMQELLFLNLEKDRVLTYTSKGIHKDDISFEMNSNSIKKIGSQGQQKSFLIALKLAQIKRIKDLTGKNPIVLLDDIFDKLDDHRVSQLIHLVNQQNFGQIFITYTNKTRTEAIVKEIHQESKIFEL